MHRGSCLCGGVTFTVLGDLPPIQVCHCGQCRRAQGTPFVTNIPLDESQVDWHSGISLIQRYESSPGKYRCFCKTCGSPLFSQRTSLPGVLRLRVGTLQGHVKAKVGFHIHDASKANWWTSQDDAQAPRYDQEAPTA
ncbi:MAG: GFA family protein [Leptothrix sp. (in: Bacteria)]|nr:GFA family protein [Leptothrix sp. (in: b-proteobacteria)]